MSTSPTYLSGPVPQGSQIGRYFSFRLMITPTLINAIYIVGLLGITIFSVYLMVHGAPAQAMMTPFGVVQSGGNSGVLDGVILLTAGNLLWPWCTGRSGQPVIVRYTRAGRNQRSASASCPHGNCTLKPRRSFGVWRSVRANASSFL